MGDYLGRPDLARTISDLSARLSAIERETRPHLHVSRVSTAQSIPTGSTTALTWDTVDNDRYGMYIAGVVAAVKGGFYLVTAVVTWATNAVGYRYADVYANGTDLIAWDTRAAVSGQSTAATLTGGMRLDAGDTISVRVNQTSGGDLLAFPNMLTIAYLGS